MSTLRRVILAAVAALAVAAPAALAALPKGGKYAGTTSDGHSVAVRLTGDAKYVKRIRITYGLRCEDGSTATTYTDVLGLKIRKDRTFSRSGTYTGSADGSKNSFQLSGKLSSSRAYGKFSLTSTVKDGKKKRRCQSGKLTWSAKRQK